MDISYCGDKTGFPRPGHICIDQNTLIEQLLNLIEHSL